MLLCGKTKQNPNWKEKYCNEIVFLSKIVVSSEAYPGKNIGMGTRQEKLQGSAAKCHIIV